MPEWKLKVFGPPPPGSPATFFVEDGDGKKILEIHAEEDWRAQGERLQAFVEAANRGSGA